MHGWRVPLLARIKHCLTPHLSPKAEVSFAKRQSRITSYVTFAVIISTQLSGSAAAKSLKQQSIIIQGAVSVFDGDTLEIGPMLIRLHGVDAPEKAQNCNTAGAGTWRCGTAASSRVRALIDGQNISCEALDRDPYGRIIARCSAGGRDIGATLIEEGLAWAFVEYSDEYVALEGKARAQAVGVWRSETQTPWDFRDDKWNRALADAPNGRCPIKGNIGAGKDKQQIYHTPWSPNYGNTRINVDDGERWFCDEAEALAAGWRPVAER